MKFIDLHRQQKSIKYKILLHIDNILNHGMYIQGPEVRILEDLLSKRVKIQHTICVSSGTDALLVALMALDIQPNDEILLPSFTFVATAEVIAILGAKPIFIDVDEDTYNIDANKIEAAITSKTKGIIAVSLFGLCPDIDKIQEIAVQHNLFVMEDAAQSFGATYKEKSSCALTQIAATSFFPAKPLGCYGDGGACFTDDEDIANKIRHLIDHGQTAKYNYQYVGINGRLDTMQAAILLTKLEIFDSEVQKRKEIASYYTKYLQKYIKTPYVPKEQTSVFAQYTLQTEKRDELYQNLQKNNIPVAIYYPVPLHLQSPYKQYTTQLLPVTEKIAKQVLSLPMHPYLQKEEQDKIISVISNFFK